MPEKLNLDSSLLKPMKDSLENKISMLTKTALLTKKESEITLKINISVNKKSNENKEIYYEPQYEFQIADKIKEEKSSYKSNLGYNYSLGVDDEDNLMIKNINEQESLL